MAGLASKEIYWVHEIEREVDGRVFIRLDVCGLKRKPRGWKAPEAGLLLGGIAYGLKTVPFQRTIALLQGSADVVGASGGVARVNDFEDDVVAGFEPGDDGVVGGFVWSGLAVDAHDDEAGCEALQVSERTGADGLDGDALGLELVSGRGRKLVDDDAESGFAGLGFFIGSFFV